jgi:hypothetical protein
MKRIIHAITTPTALGGIIPALVVWGVAAASVASYA